MTTNQAGPATVTGRATLATAICAAAATLPFLLQLAGLGS